MTDRPCRDSQPGAMPTGPVLIDPRRKRRTVTRRFETPCTRLRIRVKPH